ncbi:MAG TPA: protein kinase, partial [Planctomycetota bacterium]|nr:protein kinase [Planctomycetota bacterium]
IADALHAAHEAGVIHRDIKPPNVLIDAEGRPKVSDFGLAHLVDEQTLTGQSGIVGSVLYMSPEQASATRAGLDRRADVFSLGVVLYEMVTGSAPFRGRHAIEVLNAVINETPRPISQVNPRALAVLQPLLDRAMAKDPRDRYQTMAAFRDDLKALMRRITRETGVVPTEATATLIAPQRARSWSLTGSLGRVLGRLRPALPGREARSGPNAAGAPAVHQWQRESRPTLVVLPFRNLAMNPDAAFYEFALADGVITELAQVKSIVVRPSACIAPYVGQSVDPRQVADEMAATLVLACGFIRTQERMRVTAQLLDAASGDILWSDKVDLLSRDLLDVQDEIARRLLASLRLRLSAAEQQRLELPLTASPEAYEFYLRARDALFAYLLRTHEEG